MAAALARSASLLVAALHQQGLVQKVVEARLGSEPLEQAEVGKGVADACAAAAELSGSMPEDVLEAAVAVCRIQERNVLLKLVPMVGEQAMVFFTIDIYWPCCPHPS
jgi:hypothetical protein